MEEASVQEQMPDKRTSPIVRSMLWENFDSDIVMGTLEIVWSGPALL